MAKLRIEYGDNPSIKVEYDVSDTEFETLISFLTKSQAARVAMIRALDEAPVVREPRKRHFGACIASLRTARGWSQRDLATATELSDNNPIDASQISRIENGAIKKPHRRTRDRLIKTLLRTASH